MLLNTRTYNQDRANGPDSISYAGPANTLSVKDVLTLGRVYPKASGGFAGVARPSAKLTTTEVIDATSGATADCIFNLTGSIPKGMSTAQIEARLADMAAFCGSQAAKDLFTKLDISA